MADTENTVGAAVIAAPDTQPPTAPVVDVQAQITQALAAQQAEFAKQLKEATGHTNIKAFTDAQLLTQGKLQEFADSKAQESASYKNKFELASINNALLSAATEAVDPALISQLLAGKAVCDDNGAVTINGKPVSDAIAQLLLDKPFLAKAQGETGSGTPRHTPAGAKQITRAEFDALPAGERSQFLKTGGNVI